MVEEGKVGGGRAVVVERGQPAAGIAWAGGSIALVDADRRTYNQDDGVVVVGHSGARGRRYKEGSSRAGRQGVRGRRARRPGAREVARSPAEVSSRERLQPGALRHVLHRLSDAEVGEDVLGAALCKMRGRACVSSGVAGAHRPSEGRRTSTASKACVLEETEAGRA
jgi:hypothetical protein